MNKFFSGSGMIGNLRIYWNKVLNGSGKFELELTKDSIQKLQDSYDETFYIRATADGKVEIFVYYDDEYSHNLIVENIEPANVCTIQTFKLYTRTVGDCESSKAWYMRGKFHRHDGPAVEYPYRNR